jgi:DNA processing protein
LVEHAGSPDAALQQLDASVVDEARQRAGAVWADATARGITVLALGEPTYPAALLALEDPPPVVFAHGHLALLDRPAVALVGSRSATAYGLRAVASLVPPVARHGVAIISGLARGIDAASHQAALNAAGGTIAVLGTGVDVPYPQEHAHLYERIEAAGLLLSEALPGARAHPGSFPARNRLIAALADVVVVVEAGERSGALITAQAAAGIGRLVGAVPGPIDLPSSVGTNGLLRDGAQVITGAADIIGLLALTGRGRAAAIGPQAVTEASPPRFAAEALSDAERRVVQVLDHGPRHTDELVGASGLSPRETAAAIASLTLVGVVDVDLAGLARRR